MLVVNKLREPGDIKKVVLRKSRVEIHLHDKEELHYYATGAYDESDELSVFAIRMRNKFLDGRDRHHAQGSKAYKANTIKELQQELLDQAAYSAVLFFELERLVELLGYKPTRREDT